LGHDGIQDPLLLLRRGAHEPQDVGRRRFAPVRRIAFVARVIALLLADCCAFLGRVRPAPSRLQGGP
jgi:hypothetical protein